MARKRNTSGKRRVSIEISGSLLRLVIMEQGSSDERVSVTTEIVPWRKEARSLFSEVGEQELTTALKKIASTHKLAGTTVWLTLSGVFCVTRVITGEAESVKREMGELELRSQLYLSLGPGHKALAASVRQIDARHQHALLSVTNQRTLNAIISATNAAGLLVQLIEPSLFAVTRTLNKLQLGQAEPIMVLNLEENGVEVGIFYDGMLLLDYRPGGLTAHADVAKIIGQHLPRLQRYCSRYFRFITTKLSKVYICGEESSIQNVLKDFEDQTALTTASLAIDPLSREWDFAEGVPANSFAPALGTCLKRLEENAQASGPNLLKNLHNEQSTAFSTSTRKFLWPVAAAAILVLSMFGLKLHQQSQVDQLRAEVAEFESVRGQARVLRLSLVQSETKEKMLEQLQRQLAQPDWSQLWTSIGGCLPPNVWIDSLKIDGSGAISITGTCFAENGVFEFARWLKQIPAIDEIALTSTRPTRFDSKPAISFQLDGQLANFAGSSSGEDRHD